MTSELCGRSAVELAELVRSGEVSAVELLASHRERCEQIHADLNALVVPLFEEARAVAESVDRRRQQGETLGPLAGVPVTVKEMFAVAGTPQTIGLPARADMISEDDAMLVKRLRQADAVILGKSNVPQLGLMIETDNPVYGRTSNPHCTDRSPGGSSGGEAALVASGCSALGLGSDGGGSIRQPAHSCGICGIKPTTSRLSLEGHWVFPGFPAGFSAPGPLARSVADLELALQIFSGDHQSEQDPWTAPSSVAPSADVDLSTLRVGVYADDGYLPPSPALRRAVHEAARSLAEHGVTVEEIPAPDTEHAWEIFFQLAYADGGHYGRKELKRGARDWRIAQSLKMTSIPPGGRFSGKHAFRAAGQKYLSDAFRFMPPRRFSAARLLQAQQDRLQFCREYLGLLDERGIDALLCPVSCLPAVKHGGRFVSLTVGYTMLFNFLGMPAGTLPTTQIRPGEETDRSPGRDLVLRELKHHEEGSAGLPVGIQVVGRHWREDVVLAVMRTLEQAADRQTAAEV